ncbi:MAG: hypothetical protein ACLTMP_01335 [Eggerthella lenta]
MNQPADTNDLPVRVRRAAWLARAAFLLVFAINVQCAASFVLWPMPTHRRSRWRACRAPRRAGPRHRVPHVERHLPRRHRQPAALPRRAVIVLVQQAIGLPANRGCASGCPPATPRFPPASSASSCSTPQASC